MVRAAALLLTLAAAPVLAAPALASPCTALSWEIEEGQAGDIALRISRRMHTSTVTVGPAWRAGDWSIVSISSPVQEDAFLFFRGDPRTTQQITLWAGVARPSEAAEIRRWVDSNARGIPGPLAACFAWHVTQDPER